jgi:hypothetical protein
MRHIPAVMEHSDDQTIPVSPDTRIPYSLDDGKPGVAGSGAHVNCRELLYEVQEVF